jgi:hypothetical protein
MLACLVVVVGAQDAQEEKIRVLLERLGSESIEDREVASKDLLTLGLPALPTLEKKLEAIPEGETKGRLKGVVERLRRLAKIADVSPPHRTVTISAKGTPLKDVLADLGKQSGLGIECAEAAGDLPVTIEIAGEPALQALDRICALNGNVSASISEGRVKVAAGKSARLPAGYVEGFRARVGRVAIHESRSADATRTDVVLHVTFDAQPDQKFRSVTTIPETAATGPQGEKLAFRAAYGLPITHAYSMGNKGYAVVDEMVVAVEGGEQLEYAYLLKGAPPGLKSVASLKLKANFRFAVSVIPSSTVLTGSNRMSMLGDTPYAIHVGGRQLYLYAQQRPGRPPPPSLGDLIDLDSLVIVDGSGKENRLTSQAPKGRNATFNFQSEKELKDEQMTLKYNLLDVHDRTVEFEVKDIQLRD